MAAKKIIAERIEIPSTFNAKAKGLIYYKEIPDKFIMIFHSVRQIHTFFMRFPIDVLYLDKENKVLSVKTIKPYRIGPYHWRTKKIIEAKAGSFQHIQKGDYVEIIFDSNIKIFKMEE